MIQQCQDYQEFFGWHLQKEIKEDGQIQAYKCGRCGKKGHNARTCSTS